MFDFKMNAARNNPNEPVLYDDRAPKDFGAHDALGMRRFRLILLLFIILSTPFIVLCFSWYSVGFLTYLWVNNFGVLFIFTILVFLVYKYSSFFFVYYFRYQLRKAGIDVPPDILGHFRDLNIWQMADLGTLVFHGLDVFRSKAARSSFMIHVAVRVFIAFDLMERIPALWAERLHGFNDVEGEEDDGIFSRVFGVLFPSASRAEMARVQHFNNKATAIRNLQQLWDLCRQVYDWLTNRNVAALGLRDQYVDFSTEASRLLSYDRSMINQLTTDERKSVRELYQRGTVLRGMMASADHHLGKTVPAAFLSTYAGFTSYYSVLQSMMSDWGPRQMPVTVMITGPPGTGKSSLCHYLQRFAVTRSTGQPLDLCQHLIYHYARNAHARCDGVTGDHKVFVMEDFIQGTEVSENSPEAKLMCNVCDTPPFFPDVAAMEQIRIAVVRSEFVIITTNTILHSKTPDLGLKDPMAIVRRVDFLINMSIPVNSSTLVDVDRLPKVKIESRRGVASGDVVTVQDLFVEISTLYNLRVKQFADRESEDLRNLDTIEKWVNPQAYLPAPPGYGWVEERFFAQAIGNNIRFFPKNPSWLEKFGLGYSTLPISYEGKLWVYYRGVDSAPVLDIVPLNPWNPLNNIPVIVEGGVGALVGAGCAIGGAISLIPLMFLTAWGIVPFFHWIATALFVVVVWMPGPQKKGYVATVTAFVVFVVLSGLIVYFSSSWIKKRRKRDRINAAYEEYMEVWKRLEAADADVASEVQERVMSTHHWRLKKKVLKVQKVVDDANAGVLGDDGYMRDDLRARIVEAADVIKTSTAASQQTLESPPVVEELYGKREHKPKRKDDPIVAQISSDANALVIMNAIEDNVVLIVCEDKDMLKTRAHGFGVAGRNIIVNEHTYFSMMQEGMTVQVWRPNDSYVIDMTRVRMRSLVSDVVLLHVDKIPEFRSVVAHFPQTCDLPVADTFVDSVVCVLRRHFLRPGKDIWWAQARGYEFSTSPLVFTDLRPIVDGHIRLELETSSGDSGAIAIELNPHRPRKILGVLLGGQIPGTSIYKPVTQEILIPNLVYDSYFMSEGVLEKRTGVKFVAAHSLIEQAARQRDTTPYGFTYIGTLESPAHLNTNTQYVASPLQGVVDATEQPPHMTPWYKDGERIVPIDYFWNKTHIVRVPVSIRKLRCHVESMALEIPAPRIHWRIDVETALNGVEGTMFRELSMTTSAGYRLRHMCAGKGKKPYLFTDPPEQGKSMLIRASPQALRDIAEMEDDLDRGVVPAMVVVDAQKDERYSFAQERKFRIVSTDDVRNLIVMRKLFGSYLDAVRRMKPFGGSQVGIDAGGMDFNFLFNWLKGFGSNAICVDAVSWDLSLPWEVRLVYGEVKNMWYSMHFPDDEWGARRACGGKVSLVHYHIIRNLLYARCGGICTGIFDTADENGGCNKLMDVAIFRELCPELRYGDCVRAAFYGDDVLSVVRGADSFNQVTRAEVAHRLFGMTWVLDTKVKAVEPYQDLAKCHFLSRSFQKVGPGRLVLGALSIDTVKEIALWVKTKNPSLYGLMFRQVCEASLKEMFPHGRRMFDQWKLTVNRCLFSQHLPPIDMTYDKCMRDIFDRM